MVHTLTYLGPTLIRLQRVVNVADIFHVILQLGNPRVLCLNDIHNLRSYEVLQDLEVLEGQRDLHGEYNEYKLVARSQCIKEIDRHLRVGLRTRSSKYSL